MYNKTATKVLSVAMSAVLALTPYSTVFATTGAGTTSSGSSTTEAPPVVTEEQNVVNSTVVGAGRSQVGGTYAAKSVAGVAVKTPKADVAGALGLGKGETAYVTTWDVTEKKSPAAFASLQAAATALGGVCGPMIQFNLNKMVGGKLTPLANGEVSVGFGIPANFRGGEQYAIVRVVAGGEVQVFYDTDSNPNTITANIPAGNGALAIVRIS